MSFLPSLASLRIMLNQKDLQIVRDFKSRLPLDLAAFVSDVLVFGSRARNEASSDSDLDIAVLLKEHSSESESRLDDIAYQVMWDYDFRPIISLKVFSESEFHDAAKQFSFYRNVLREGVSI